MKEQIAAALEQARLFVLQHAPSDLLREALPFGILCIILGVGLSVLGAKVGRFAIATAFSVVGGYLGSYFGGLLGWSQSGFGWALVFVLSGAFMLAVVGYQTFRLWVGLATAAVLSAAVLGVFGYQRVFPHVAAFEQTFPSAATLDSPASDKVSDSFGLPTRQQQEAYQTRSVGQWAREFRAFVTQRDAQLGRSGEGLALGTMLTGLCLGVVAVRWALILCTAVVGTAFVTTGIATLFTHSVPQSVDALRAYPSVVGIAVGAFFVSSLILQTMLTRKPPSGKNEAKSKS